VNTIWTTIWITAAIQVLCALVIYVPPVLAPVAQAEVGVPASTVGVVTSLIFAAATVAALLSGSPIARLGALRVSQGSLVFCGVGLALMATANTWIIAIGALIVGLGYGVVTPSSSSILAERAPEGLRAFIFSLKQTGVPIGGALAGAIIPSVMLAFGWRVAALAAALACVLLALALEPWRKQFEGPRALAGELRALSMVAALRLVLSNSRLRELALASFAYSGMQSALGSYLVVYLHERVGFGVSAAGFALSVAMVAGIAGRIFWGVVADRMIAPRRLLALLGLAMSLAALLTSAITPAWPTAVVLALSLVFGATAVGWNGVYLAEVARIASARDAATATGASLAMTYAGVVVMPLVFWGIVHASGSYGAAYAVAGALTLWRSTALFRSVAPVAVT
jgi:MFS family permease